MLSKLKAFLKKEPVLCIAALCALVTVFFVLPDKEYLHYIDWRVLCLLFCLMAVVAGFQAVGFFRWLTELLLKYVRNGRILSVALVMLPFFSAMAVTNDVALLIFVPFTLSLLEELGQRKAQIPMVVLQTVAANLGSMATPVGNPQNLFLYSAYDLGAGEFFAVTLPLAAVSLVALCAAALPVLPKALPKQEVQEGTALGKGKLAVYSLLFVLCLLTVLRIVPFVITTLVIVAVFLLLDRKLLGKVDYMLLLTFVCFFVVSENLGRIEAVRVFLQGLLAKNTLLTAVGASQVISNVPAAVLLSPFTDQWQELLAGVNIGGLGTPIASLASLISLKLYMAREGAKTGKFLLVFTAANIIGLALLLAFSILV